MCQQNHVTLRDNTNEGGSDVRVTVRCCLSTARPAHDKRTSVVYCLLFVFYLARTWQDNLFIPRKSRTKVNQMR